MPKLKLSGKELRSIGFPEGPVISVAMNLMEKHYKHVKKEEVMNILRRVLASPVEFGGDAVLAIIAEQLMPKEKNEAVTIRMKDTAIHFDVFGAGQIEQGAMYQMELSSKLPVTIAGALMPDAHAGYGLPIGGVLATENAVIPYGVGVDIGCRMCLSVFDINPKELVEKEQYFIRELNEATLFGSGRDFEHTIPHEVIDRKEFEEIGLLKKLQARAAKQLGSSGSGNHFVEFGIVEIKETDKILNLSPGNYLGLLSHSGSRGLGANIANHYTRIARAKRKLPGDAANLAWLTLNEQEGVEYWMAMNLAGDYASACHQVIHQKISRQLNRLPLTRVENHHNFAWKEIHEGRELIVHRKGATPAGKDVLGIIPGSMIAPGYIVKGKGQSASLYSAAHGAGRKMSRTNAIKSITHHLLRETLEKNGVKLIGGGLDEAPQAYKDIEEVMVSQKQLVDVGGKFIPKIVKMDGGKGKHWGKRREDATPVDGE
jgi:tRNA-splicing ligase RtcB